ncbi:hypothetical protein BGP_6144 [Beggiatoa sp. PS]|nr:hypothetical protein BGP_6144 [Beggiatoa sp. PS]
MLESYHIDLGFDLTETA